MGRPEPCVLFSQTFVHPNLDEYVDEVLFNEPVVITACEFLEQNASSTSQSVTLVGATAPPSFALEVFVQCEGETRFRRLCQPFLYSHSSSNVLEVEAVVTNHLVVRGSYRSLSLVIYGNTAEDLGQFNIEFDDSSITNLVSSVDGKLEDLPLPLRSTTVTMEEPISALKALSFPLPASDMPIEIKQLLQVMLKVWECPNLGSDRLCEIVSILVSVASSCVTHAWGKSDDRLELQSVITGATKDLYEICQHETGAASANLLEECSLLDSETDLATSKQLVDMLRNFLIFESDSVSCGHHQISQGTHVIMGLSIALLLCSGRESCFQFVNGGGMEQLGHVLCHDKQKSTATTLLLLGIAELATRFSFGCEGFLGWWPREDENIPSRNSEGYGGLLNLLLLPPRHAVASFATRIVHRLRFYEVISRYESSVLSILEGASNVDRIPNASLDMLINAKLQLKMLLKLITSCRPIEDPSPVAHAARSQNLGQIEGLLSYKATSCLIAASDCCFSNRDVDLDFLALLKERGFLPLSVALLSSSALISEAGHAMDAFVDILSSIQAIIISLLSCRSGLIFLLQQPDLCATLIDALKGADVNKDTCLPLRYASVLTAKGFLCSSEEVGMIIGIHLRVVNAMDHLLTSAPHSEEFLGVLWELCAFARFNCGRQALLALGYFPEVMKILIEALHSAKEPEPVAKNNGAFPLNLAIFHSAAEIFEVIVTDSTVSSLGSWIGHAIELHRALHSSSPGSNRKDAPIRLLEWIDAGVVYHKNGATGLLRYAAVLASGGDALLTSAMAIVSDLTDIENIIGDTSSGSDVNVMETLGKLISEKTFDGVILRDSSVAQLTTTLRILAFISENSAVAAALYDEGAITIIYTLLVNCRLMLEKSSNSYDYLVDEGTECNASSDLLLERNRDQSLVDLLVPSLVLLINLLQKLQEAEEQHRNTKLMNALLRLHREVSPKLAECVADLSSSYPDSTLGFGAISHLIASALAVWPVYGWTPGLFHSLLTSVQSTKLLTLGPKETCSLFCLLNDLFPEEGVWHWRNGMPMLSALRALSVRTLLGPRKEKQVNWYLQPMHQEKLLGQLMPQLDKIAQIIQHYAISTLVVIQDMLRVFIVRIGCQKAATFSMLLPPILSWISERVSDSYSPSEMDGFKVYRYLYFLSSLLEHPRAKEFLVKAGFIQLLSRVLGRCFAATESDGKQILDGRSSAKYVYTMQSWCLPVFKSFSILSCSGTSAYRVGKDIGHNSENLSTEDSFVILSHLLKFCQVLQVGKELLACLTAFKELGSCKVGQSSLVSIYNRVLSRTEEVGPHGRHERDSAGSYGFLNDFEWRKKPPLLCCWQTLFQTIDYNDGFSDYAIECLSALSLGSLSFCMDGKSLNLDQVAAMKFLFGIHDQRDGIDGAPEENICYVNKLTLLLSSKIDEDEYEMDNDMKTAMNQVLDSTKALLSLLQKPADLVTVEDVFSSNGVPVSSDDLFSSKVHLMSDDRIEWSEDSLFLALDDKFQWECPEPLPDRFSQTTLAAKRKMPSAEGSTRRARGDNPPSEVASQNAFARGLGSSATSSAPTRRDTFRQRKPNTSRPPSMHVDDYVARERNVDGATNSNVIAVQRVGATSGRPPSIHVDEFMARQRGRENPMSAVVGELAIQAKNAAPLDDQATEKPGKTKQLKADLDDDLHGIDIVFDGEESESDDKLPFPHDDNLQQPAPLIVEQNSPRSIVEETESSGHDNVQFPRLGTPLASNVDENTPSEFSARMSVSRPDKPLTREPSVSSEKKYFEQSDDTKNVITVNTSCGFDSGAATNNNPRFPGSVYGNASAPFAPLPVNARTTPQILHLKNIPVINVPVPPSQGPYDPRFMLNQPPLPPVPPPPTVVPVMSQTSDPAPSQSSPFVNTMSESYPPGFQVHPEYHASYNNSSTSKGPSIPMADSKFSRNSISSPASARPPPPLPLTPPPYSSSPYNLTSKKTSASQSSLHIPLGIGSADHPQNSAVPSTDARLGSLSSPGVRGNAYAPPPPQIQYPVFSRPGSIPVIPYGNFLTQQPENQPSVLPNLGMPQSMHSLTQLQPLQPPQLPQPPQPPQHLRPPMQSSQQLEQGVSMQGLGPMQIPSLQIMQQPQASPMHAYYQPQQQEFSHVQQHQQQIEHAQPQAMNPPMDASTLSLQQQDPGMSLLEFFKSPEAIQSLLSDREKLCQLLEQHPKLMQMLQERLGQL